MEDYKVILGASAYFDKGILKEEDLKEINEAINKQYEEIEDNSSNEEIPETEVEEIESEVE